MKTEVLSLLLALFAQEDSPHVCRHGDQGASRRLDLAAVRRAYTDLRKGLEKSLASHKAKAMGTLNLEHDAKLPRCRSASERQAVLREVLPPQFRGRTFYFVHAENCPWEAEIAKDVPAEVLVLAAKRPADAAELAKRIKRPVTFATKELAQALGVECSASKVSVGENGRDLAIHERP